MRDFCGYILQLSIQCIHIFYNLQLCSILLTCSPSGKLVQIEYALAAVGAGSPSVGIKGKYLHKFVDSLKIPCTSYVT